MTRAFQFLGKRWNGVILANLFEGPTTFSALARRVSGISDSMLSDRLSELARAGLVSRTVHEGPPVTVVYELAPSGLALLPALRELEKWSAENLNEQACQAARAAGARAEDEPPEA